MKNISLFPFSRNAFLSVLVALTVGGAFNSLIAQTPMPVIKVSPTVDTVYGTDTVYFDLVVEDFNNVLAFQMSLNWDPEILSLVNVSNFNDSVPDLNTSFNIPNDSSLVILWVDLVNGTTFTVLDNEVFLRVGFVGLTDTCATSVIRIDNEEVVYPPPVNQVFPVIDSASCAVNCQAPVSLFEPQPKPSNFSVSIQGPNPVKEETSFLASFKGDGRLVWRVLDVDGREVYGQNRIVRAGALNLFLTRSMVNDQSGMYYVSFEYGVERIQKTVVFK